MNQEIESRMPKPSRDRERIRTNIGHIRVDSMDGIGTTPRMGEVVNVGNTFSRVEPGEETENESGRI